MVLHQSSALKMAHRCIPSPGICWHLGNCVSHVICRNGGCFVSWSYICTFDLRYSECCIPQAGQVRLLLKYSVWCYDFKLSALTNALNDPTMTMHHNGRGSMTAATLRSSEWNRSPRAFEILDSDTTGRIRIFVVQFQGHLFFGWDINNPVLILHTLCCL